MGKALVGGIFGLIAGAGAGLYLSQTGTIDMSSSSSLVVPGLGLLIGLILGFTRRRRRI